MNFLKKYAWGILLCLVIAVPAWLLGKRFEVVGGPVFAILIGMVIALFWKEQEESAIRFPCRYVDLDTLYVRPEAKGRGIGTTLYQAACQWAKAQGADRMELMTLGENRNARAFYGKMGMQEQQVILTTFLK